MKPEKQQGEGGGSGGGKKGLGRWLGAPVRALSRACDSYVRKMSACAGAMPTQYAGATGGRGGFGGGGMQQAAMFSSRSTRRGPNGGDEDVSELVRAMSKRQQQRERDVPVAAVQARSRSVAVGRIDEDAPYEFGADAGKVGLPPRTAVRRSRSAAVVGSGLPPRVGVGGGFGASAVPSSLPPRVGGGGGFGASAPVTRRPAVGVVHGG